MTLTDRIVKNIIKHLIKGQDYRVEIIPLINAEFLDFTVDLFKKVVDAKFHAQAITIDWYRHYFFDTNKFKSDEAAIYLGMNKKTVFNMFNSATKEIVIQAASDNYEGLLKLIDDLVKMESELNVNLTITFRDVSVSLNLSESLVVINALAVKRAALSGSAWSTAGKKVEQPLMMTLCKIFSVPSHYFDQSQRPDSMREVDFFLKDQKNNSYRCEVKLMGKGNPEGADTIFARKSDIFIADKLSDLNKRQAENLGVNWVELRTENGYQRFADILRKLDIPFTDFQGNLDHHLDSIVEEIFYSEQAE